MILAITNIGLVCQCRKYSNDIARIDAANQRMFIVSKDAIMLSATFAWYSSKNGATLEQVTNRIQNIYTGIWR